MKQPQDEATEIDKAFFLAARAFVHSFKDSNFLAEFKLDRAQYYTLMWIEDHQRARLKDLAQLMDLDQSTVSRHVNQLEALSLVKKENDSDDLRAWFITLTPKGKNILDSIELHRRQILQQAIKNWSKKDKEMLKSLLERLWHDLTTHRETKEEQ
jgi:DNA-binding MarR family transcriptional regulator